MAFVTKVGQLNDELEAVELDLDATYNAGLAQAVADRKAIEARGRARAALPYPALTERERERLAIDIGGLSWRVIVVQSAPAAAPCAIAARPSM